jgi:hypothetical protein
MKQVFLGLILVGSIALAGCSDSNAPGHALSLSFAGRSASVAGSSSILAAPAATATTADVLVIDKAQVVVRKIELKSSEEDDCEDQPQSTSCAEIKAGPVLVDVPTTAGAKPEITVVIPAGTYQELEFKIHKVSSSDTADASFRAANPDFVDKSVRVTGTFNGTAFTFESDVTAVQEMDLNPALVVTDSKANTNLTVNFTLDSWFRAPDGSLIDPSTANKGGVNEMLVKSNIRRSLRAFEDEDHNGDDDHDEHGMSGGDDDHHSAADSSEHEHSDSTSHRDS